MQTEKESKQSPGNQGQGGESHQGGAPGKGKKIAVITAVAFLGIVVIAGLLYTYLSGQYKEVFFPNTIINGLDVSGKTVAEVKDMIDSSMDEYTLTLEGRGGTQEQIVGEQIGLHPEYDGSLENILASQEPFRWGLHLFDHEEHTIETMVIYDQDRLESVVGGLDSMDRSKTEAPVDAYLSDYQEGIGYTVIPDQPGTWIDSEKMLKAVSDGILNLKSSISLEEEDVYEHAQVTADDADLVAEAELWNSSTNVTIDYHFGDQEEVLNGDIIHTWISKDEEGNMVLDEEKVAEYVAQLAATYDTASKPKVFKTTNGEEVTISKGTYGWKINQSAEAAALSEIIRSGISQEREPVYSQTAASRGENDYGNTYVEINLTAQHLYFYVNGSLVVETDFVSGNEARGFTTPSGAYPLNYKQRNAVLRGPGYASPVSYWMPFNGGICLHDASWRGAFGGRIYKTNGSHGCINLPRTAAQKIFEQITAGDPVLCYRLEGTEPAKTSSPGKAAAAPAVPAAAPVPSEPVPTVAPNPEEGATEGETSADPQQPQLESPTEETKFPEEGGPAFAEPTQTEPVGPGYTEPAGPTEPEGQPQPGEPEGQPQPAEPQNQPQPAEPQAPAEEPPAPAPVPENSGEGTVVSEPGAPG